MFKTIKNVINNTIDATIINAFTIISRYFVTLDPVLNSSYEMAQPITFAGDFEIEVEYSSSSTVDWEALVGDDTTTDGIQFTNLDKIRVRPFDIIFTPTIPRDGSLRKLKITRNGTLLSLFLDGALLDTAAVTSNSSMQITQVGSLLNSNYFDGIIANAKFTDKSGASDVVTTFKLNNSPAAANYVYGGEEVVNGDFATDSDWAKQGTSIIADGKYQASGLTSYGYITYQNNSNFVAGVTYLISFEIKDYVSGVARLRLKGTVGADYSQNGTYSEVITAGGGDNFLAFLAWSGGAFTGSIDNVTVKEITNYTEANAASEIEYSQENVFGSEEVVNGDFATDLSGWTVYTQTAVWSVDGIVINASAGTAQVSQLLSLQANSTYEVSLKNVSKTNVRIMLGTDWWRSDQYSSDNSNEYIKFYVTPTVSSVWIQLNIGYGGMATLDNVSVKKITNAVEYKNIPQSARELYSLEDDTWVSSEELVINGDFATDSDWIKDTGWSISGGSARSTEPLGFARLRQYVGIVAGITYNIKVDVDKTSSAGQIILRDSNLNAALISNSGSTEIRYTYVNTTSLEFLGFQNWQGSIDNVSVKQVLEVAS